MEDNSTMADNSSTKLELPIDMQFNDGHVVSIATYSVLMVISAIGNSTVLFLISRRRRNSKTRINTMLMHLAIADLLVTFLMMPLEIGWAITVSWKAGDAMCRIMAFFRIFGLYLSSFILICISIDRYYAVLRPLQIVNINRRSKIMLIGAWVGSTLCSMPQMLVFHVETHPNFTWYEQCITFNTFPSFTHELTYSLFGMLMMYWLPLIVIIYSYTSILVEIYKRSRDSNPDKIRRSSLGFLGKARIRTLKMTIIIVLVFFVCWTPYYVMSLWYWVDRSSAVQVDQKVQRALFLFACTNSCMNPIVYGAFNIRNKKKETTSHRVISSEKKGLGLQASRDSLKGNQSVNFSQHENLLTQSQRDSTKTIKLTEFGLDICNVEKFLTRHLENALQDDEFSISINHIRPRKKPVGEDEILLAAEFSKTKDKFVLMLDRHTKRVILETAENGFSCSEHLVIDSLDVIDPIKNLVFVLRQKQPEAHLEIYADCLYQGEIPLRRTMREMSEIEDSSSLRVFRERRCRIKIHKSGDVDYVLQEENCPANMTNVFNNLKGIDESFKSDRIRRDREDRGDIPAPVFIGSDCVGGQDLSNITRELVRYIKVIREELRENTEETRRIRNLLDNCLACKGEMRGFKEDVRGSKQQMEGVSEDMRFGDAEWEKKMKDHREKKVG
ncbi:gonadotropin-releasing hormone II receptor [Belonocnema kinseyi]|uniref:gonadotropin-releasing hormone II receptor n=1 Tax=Belonocnema kinseyi TaxID=2817044 RepID=UPI00143CF158|nr:gonadotropin-releasing hormone II receptor [Belonocnema kinseyi]